MIPENVLRSLIAPYGVSESEFEVLTLSFDGQSTNAIAIKLQIKPDAVRKRLGEVYKKFDITGGGPGKLARLQQILIAKYQLESSLDADSNADVSAAEPAQPKPKLRWDWGEAIDVGFFCGRKKELTELQRWIVDERCRLVALLGMGGIGKTSLSVRLANQLKEEFDCLVWRSLRNPLPIDQFLTNLITSLSGREASGREAIADAPEAIEGKLSQFIYHLRQHRCLIVLDNFETLLKSGERAGHYQEKYEGYGKLISRIGEASHNSCLIITSREKPKEIASLEGDTLPVRSLQLDGLDQTDGQEILKTKKLFGPQDQWFTLIQHYGGNPLALKIVSTAIQDLFDGNISEFLQEGAVVFGEIRDLLDQQFNRLFGLEKEIMYWLAINYEPIPLSELRKDLVSPSSSAKLLEALESLGRRGIIEHAVRTSQLLRNNSPAKTGTSFTLQPVVMEYVIDRLIEQICTEITANQTTIDNSIKEDTNPSSSFIRLADTHSKNLSISFFLNTHALIKAQAKDYVRNAQIRSTLKPIADKLIGLLGSEFNAIQRLRSLLLDLQQNVQSRPGYAGGNILNLLVQLNADLAGYDFSGLTVWQAYLQDVDLPNVKFINTDLSRSVFAETLGSILSVSFNPTGELLATGDANGKIRLQVVDGEQLFICDGHTGWVRSVMFSPDGQVLASGSDDQMVKLWDANTGQCLKTLHGHTGFVRSVSFSPDGQLLASASDDQTVKLWNIDTGRCLKTLKGHTGRVRSVAFSPDGQIVASSSSDRTINLWHVATGESMQTLHGHSDRVLSIAYNSDGSRLASCSADHTIKLWDTSSGECFSTLHGHKSGVLSVRFSIDGEHLASSSDDQTVKLWSVATRQCLATLRDHKNRVWCVTFSPNSQLLASGSDDQTVRLWDVNTRECLRTLQGYNRGIRSITFSPDGQSLASGGEDRMVRLWDVNTTQPLRLFQGHTRRVWCVSFSPDGQTLASGSDDQTVNLWDIHSGKRLKTLHGHSDWVRSVAFSPDGRYLVSSGDDRIIQIWDIETGEDCYSLKGHRSWVWCISFSPNGNLLASGSNDKTVRLWNTATWDCLTVLEGHTDSILSVAFSPDGQILASGSIDQTVRLWDIHTGTCIRVLQEHENWVRSVAFLPQKRFLSTEAGSLQNTKHILATGSGDQTVKLWDVATGTCLRTLEKHTSRVRSVAFSPDGRILASGGNDEAIRLWDVETGDAVGMVNLSRPYDGMDITGAKGLTESYRTTLVALGAIDRSSTNLPSLPHH